VLNKGSKGKNEESGQDRTPSNKASSNVSIKIEGRILWEKVERGKIITHNDHQCVSRYTDIAYI
jgi:hypothetical protein